MNHLTKYQKVLNHIFSNQYQWVVTGVAGFIGSNLLELLLKHNQKVVGLDNFSTGKQENILDVKSSVSNEQWGLFQFVEGDIRNYDDCVSVCKEADFVLHQAALGSVPRSIENPLKTNANNVDGFLNMLFAAKDAKVRKMVYAASSSTYGDHPDLPKVENIIGKPLSPYAVTKLVNELYADVFSKTYGFGAIGLRYFNVFGKRQDPDGAYAAVIPKWISALLANDDIYINGDGKTSRDFCYIDNAVQANILAAMLDGFDGCSEVFNVAVGDRTSLYDLFVEIRNQLSLTKSSVKDIEPSFRDFRVGDVKHSLADISKSSIILGYAPTHRLREGLNNTVAWYLAKSQ